MAGTQERSWVWYGGAPFLDFVNTRKVRFAGGLELLRSPADLDEWLRVSGAGADCRPTDDSLLAEAIHLRESIDALVRAAVADAAPPGPAVDEVNRWLEHPEISRPLLEQRDGGLILRTRPGAGSDSAGALAWLAHGAAEVVGGPERGRLRICGGDSCSARFLDKSAGRRRRWCQMGVCGNRAKAARHRQRQMEGFD